MQDKYDMRAKLLLGEHPQTGKLVFGIAHDGCFIHDLRSSECGRFEVDPQEAYGVCAKGEALLVLWNVTLRAATETAMRQAARVLARDLGVGNEAVVEEYLRDVSTYNESARPVAMYLISQVVRANSH